jgi:HAD superfamily phosphatase (TIGR01681 family)
MIYIFDLDDTLTHEGFDDIPGVYVCEQAEGVLRYLANQNHTLAVASHNNRAYSILKKNNIAHFFDPNLVIGFEHESKKPHIAQIMGITNQTSDKYVYIDDMEIHVQEAREMGLGAKLCSWQHGVTMQDILLP